MPTAATGGAGIIADGSGTGWSTLALKGIWRPQGAKGEHIVDLGVQQDSYVLKYLTSSITGNWLSDAPGTLASEVGGRTALRSLYAQDAWAFAPRWKTVLGARLENWTASNGFTTFGIGNPANAAYARRSKLHITQGGLVLPMGERHGAEGDARHGCRSAPRSSPTCSRPSASSGC